MESPRRTHVPRAARTRPRSQVPAVANKCTQSAGGQCHLSHTTSEVLGVRCVQAHVQQRKVQLVFLGEMRGEKEVQTVERPPQLVYEVAVERALLKHPPQTAKLVDQCRNRSMIATQRSGRTERTQKIIKQRIEHLVLRLHVWPEVVVQELVNVLYACACLLDAGFSHRVRDPANGFQM